MRITEYFVKRPVLFWSLMVGIIFAGIISFIQMPKLEDPAVAVKQAMVVIPYPGASAHEVELNVAQTSFPINSSDALTGITVNGKAWNDSQLAARTLFDFLVPYCRLQTVQRHLTPLIVVKHGLLKISVNSFP